MTKSKEGDKTICRFPRLAESMLQDPGSNENRNTVPAASEPTPVINGTETEASPEPDEFTPLLPEMPRGISSSRRAANGQSENSLVLNGILDAAIEIAQKRRETLARLREALKANNAVEVFRSAKDLCGLSNDEKSV